jgi:PKD repeat protein
MTALNVPLHATYTDNGNGTGTFNFSPDFTQSGLFSVTFIASDGALADSEVVVITVTNVNRAPVLASIGPRSVNEGANLNFNTSATDPDGTTPTMTAINVPTNATYTNNGNGTGTFNFSPSFTQSGVYNVTFIASDGALADSEVVVITVTNVNRAPVLASIGPRSVNEGANLNFTTSATDPDGTTPTMTALNVPLHATYTDNGNGTGTFSFSPNFAQAGVYSITFIASDGSLADNEVVVVTVVDAGNQRPVLAAIGPKSVLEGANLNFNVTATDPDATYPVLTALNVPSNATFVDHGNGTATFNFNPNYIQSGVYTVTFIASDGTLADSEAVVITVTEAGNQRPILASIGPRSVTEGAALNFTVTATDPDSTVATLFASGIPTNATFSDNGDGSGAFSFNPIFTQAGTYSVTFIAFDGALADSELVTITVVEAGNQPPVLAAIGPRSVNENANLNFNISATDPDGTTPSLSARNVPTNASFADNGNGTGTFNFNPNFSQAGIYNVTFIAFDGGKADTEIVAITVNNINRVPVLAAIGAKSVTEGQNLNFNTSATDPDGTTPVLSAVNMPTNATFVNNGNGTGTFNFNPSYVHAGVYSVTFIASDGSLADSEVVAITVNEAGNQRPVLASIGPKSVAEGATLNFNTTASDPDGSTPTLSAVGVPTNATFTDNGNGTGTFHFSPSFAQGGLYSVTFIASDGALADSELVAITVTDAGNQAPVLAAIGPRSVNEAATLNFSTAATDFDGTTPIMTAVNLPTNATYTDNLNGTGTFSFTPDYSQAGIYSITFIASDGSFADSEIVAITVNNTNRAPVLAAIGAQSVNEGAVLNFSASATDPDGTSPIMTAINLPANATYTDHGNGTATLNFNPNFTQAGVYNVTFIASDGALADSELVAITVNNTNQSPILATIGPKSVPEGANLNFGISATDPDVTTPTLTAVGVPTNATFTDNGNGTGTFSFNPIYTQTGVYSVTFIASDGALADSEVVAITVIDAGNQRPVLAAIGPKSVPEGANLNFGISATDPDVTTPTLTAVGVPTNATFTDNGNGTGTFNFNPTYIQSGVFNVTFIASDGALADSEVVAITVIDAGNQRPVLAAIGPKSVSEGASLNFGISATDPDATTPTLTAVGVPTNATFTDNGNGTGTFNFNPTYIQSGVYNVTFIASDGALADSEVVAITVIDAGNQRPVLAAIGPKSVSEGANLNFGISATDADATTPTLTALGVPANATFTDNGNGTGTFNFNPTYIQAGVYSVTFIASDGSLADSEVVAITVNDAGNQRPILAAIGPKSIAEGANLNFGISATDADATTPSLTAVGIPTNATFLDNGNGTGTFNFNPTYIQAGIYNVTFIASDGALADSEVVAITVIDAGNQRPVLAAIGPKSVSEGASLNFGISATDADATTPTLTAVGIPTNATFTDNGNGTGTFSFNPVYTQTGVYSVTFIASDGALADSEVVAITVIDAGNQRPVLAAIGPKSVPEGANLNFGISATDADATTPSLTAVGVPTNATFTDNGNGTGTFNFNPTYIQSGVYNVTFIASDGSLADSEVVAITVNDAGNQRPILAAIGPKSIAEGANLNFGISATDADATTPSLTAVGIPTNATFLDNGNGTGTFNFNPTYIQAGIYNVTFIASDGSLADSEVVAITVNDAGNQRPVLAAIGPKSVNENANLNFGISATDADATIPTLTAVNMPANATLTDHGNGTATFNFNPNFTQSGVYNVTFIASDGSLADSEAVVITVINVNRAPVLATIGPRSVNEGANLNFGVSTTDPDATTPALTAVGVPTNATFTDNGNGTGTLNFSPNYTQSGVYSVTFIASDGALADSEIVAITVVNVNLPPVLAAIGPRSVSEGTSLSFGVSATDPDATIPTLSAVNVPLHATFTDSGNGTGTFGFNPDYTQSGVYNVTFIASDGVLADSEIVIITVNNFNRAPILATIGPGSVSEGANLNFSTSATDPDAQVPTMTALNVPVNATYTDNGNGTGVFNFNPSFFQSGIYNVTFIASDGSLADSEVVVITVVEQGTGAPPRRVSDLNAQISGDAVRLFWTAITADTNGVATTVDHYVIYRKTTAFFNPVAADSIGTAAGAATQFMDNNIGGANVVGDTIVNYFYVIRAVDSFGRISKISNRVGEYDYQIVITATSDFNLAALPFAGTGIVDAQGLIASMGGTTNINTVNNFIAASQSYQARFAAGFGVNFAVQPGSVFQVNAKQNFAWSVAGQVPDSGTLSYNIVTTATTDYSLLMIPLEYAGVFTVAQDVINNIPTLLNTLNEFLPSSQSYRSRFAAGFGTNFAVKAGRVYQANGKAAGVFPRP